MQGFRVSGQVTMTLRWLFPVPVEEIVVAEEAFPIQTVAAVTVLPAAEEACRLKPGLLLAIHLAELVNTK